MNGTVIFDFDDTLADTAAFKEALAASGDEDATIWRMAEFVFPAAGRILRSLKEEGWALALVTFGEPAWQRRKLDRSGLLPFFDHAIFTAAAKEERVADFDEWPKPLVFVDDHGGELDAIKRLMPDALMIAVRGNKPAPLHPDASVCADLEEVYKEIRKAVQ